MIRIADKLPALRLWPPSKSVSGMATTSVHSRLLLLELDSVRQAERLGPSLCRHQGAEPLADAVRDLVGMIRTSLMIADQLLVTDSMILDGAFFALVPPSHLAEALGCSLHELPLTVLSSSATLRGALSDKRDNPEFAWQLSGLLPPEHLERHWAAWSDPTLPFRVESYGSHGSPLHPDGFVSRTPPSSLTDGVPVVSDFTQLAVKTPSRSAVETLCAEAKTAHPEDSDLLEGVRRWWESAYLIRIAESNRADWLTFDSRSPAEDDAANGSTDGDETHARQQKSLRVDGALRTTLSLVPPSLYAIMRFKVQPERTALRHRPSRYRFRNLTYALTHLVEKKSRPVEVGAAAGRGLLALIAIMAAVPNLSGTIFGIDIAWVAFSVAAVATIPFGDVRTFVDTMRRRPDAELFIQPEESHV